MSLKGFHILFISLSSLLSFGFGGWSLHAWSSGRGGTYLGLGVGAFVIGAGLIVYGTWFLRKIKTQAQEQAEKRKRFRTVKALAVALGVWALSTQPAPACSVCYGDSEGPMIEAARLGVWLLFGMVAMVQLCFAAFFITLWRRSRKGAD